MRLPALLVTATLVGVVPVAVALVYRRRVRGPRAWLLAWCLWNLATDLLTFWLALHHIPNLSFSYVLMPVSVALALWTLSLWQDAELWRLTFRIAIVPLLVAWGALALAVEDLSSFSSVAEPMVKLVTLAAAAFTLVTRSAAGRGDVLRHDWFWVSAGLALYFGAGATLGPASRLLAGGSVGTFLLVYDTWAVLEIAANLLIAKGMACRTDR